jgi:phenylalanyl-tRNA synthetase beta chain
MPTIEVRISDLASLLSGEVTRELLEDRLKLVKGELKEFDPKSDQAKIELNDSNRPDLWSPEGIARQIRWVESGQNLGYPYFAIDRRSDYTIDVSKEVQTVRPYIAACAVREVRVTEEILAQLIQTQEKLAEIFGRKRQTVSIGLYRLSEIAFPIRYELADPNQTRFVPLGFEEEMTLREILERHPKGRSYGPVIARHPRLPILADANDRILSFPPIINSRAIGEVRAGDADLLVETTGEDLRMVMLALNVFACNLIDRGGRVEPVTVHYPYPTDYGRKIQMPRPVANPVSLNLNEVGRALGETMPTGEIKRYLSLYGHTVIGKGKRLKVSPPLYRDDVMHPIDLIEDIAIVRGYDSFSPEMPAEFTVGKLSEVERLSDRFRDRMVGLSFQEIVSNILTSRIDLLNRMRVADALLVEVGNPMAESYSVLRDSLIPSLLSAETQSAKAFYPHRIFEAGEVARPGGREGTETAMNLAALVAHASANFSELHAQLESLFYYSRIDYRLEPTAHDSFIEGRAGRIVVSGEPIGLIGEIHPEVLERWQIGMPCVVFEFALDPLLGRESSR